MADVTLLLWLFFSVLALPALLLGGWLRKMQARPRTLLLTAALAVQALFLLGLHDSIVFVEPAFNYAALGIAWLCTALQLATYRLMAPGRLYRVVRLLMVLGALTGIFAASFLFASWRHIPHEAWPRLTQQEMAEGIHCRARTDNGLLGHNGTDAFLYRQLAGSLLMQQIPLPATTALFSSSCAMLYRAYQEISSAP